MNAPGTLWERLRDEVRSVKDRTTRGAQRAFDEGVTRVDLVSLRRERHRALADLGERTLTLFREGTHSRLESDPEMIRLRERVDGVDAAIAAKEDELYRLRTAKDTARSAPESEATGPRTPES